MSRQPRRADRQRSARQRRARRLLRRVAPCAALVGYLLIEHLTGFDAFASVYSLFRSGQPFDDPLGAIIASVAVLILLTAWAWGDLRREDAAQARAEATLLASEASMAEAQRLAHVGSWRWDIVRDTLHWSDETYRILGLLPQIFVPNHERLLATIHPDDRATVMAAVAAALAGNPPEGVEHRIVRPDGTVRVVHQRAETIRDAAGAPVAQVGVMLDITERAALERRLAYQATHDTLTGLPNRALLLERLGQALIGAEQTGRPCAVLFLDLDHFKRINDSLGHAAGDALVIAVAARLREGLRTGDTLARLGGDEFVALLPDLADADEACASAERLHAALHDPIEVEGREIVVTTSIGLALAGGVADTPEDLLRHADVAVYRAKEGGRGRTALFNPAMGAAARARLALERDLRAALAREELQLYYQPKVDLLTGRVAALEALVRWPHPARGIIGPGEFIPLAEETGLIVPLGRWALREGCRQLVAWGMTYPDVPLPRLAINLSAREFRDPDLVARVAATLATTGLAPDRLILEITETSAMERPEEAIATLRALRALGVRLALDDFGTGHSSLAYLQRLPLDTLKIDRSFLADTPQNRAIVGAVAALAHGLRLDVTAEGLETAEQVAWARAAGCDRGQGYFFACPLPPDQIAALLATGAFFALPGTRQFARGGEALRVLHGRATLPEGRPGA